MNSSDGIVNLFREEITLEAHRGIPGPVSLGSPDFPSMASHLNSNSPRSTQDILFITLLSARIFQNTEMHSAHPATKIL